MLLSIHNILECVLSHRKWQAPVTWSPCPIVSVCLEMHFLPLPRPFTSAHSQTSQGTIDFALKYVARIKREGMGAGALLQPGHISSPSVGPARCLSFPSPSSTRMHAKSSREHSHATSVLHGDPVPLQARNRMNCSTG